MDEQNDKIKEDSFQVFSQNTCKSLPLGDGISGLDKIKFFINSDKLLGINVFITFMSFLLLLPVGMANDSDRMTSSTSFVQGFLLFYPFLNILSLFMGIHSNHREVTYTLVPILYPIFFALILLSNILPDGLIFLLSLVLFFILSVLILLPFVRKILTKLR